MCSDSMPRFLRWAPMTALMALVAIFIVLIPQTAHAKQTSDGFEYEIGNWVLRGEVQRSAPQSMGYTIEKEYGCTVRYDNGSAEGQAISCGYGVYITGYYGTSKYVQIPSTIDGINVVYADMGDEFTSTKSVTSEIIDVRECRNLKKLSAWAPSQLLFESGNKSLIDIYLQTGENISYLNLTCLDNLERFYCYTCIPSFSINVSNLKCFCSTVSTLSNLNLSGARKLEHLELYNSYLYNETLNLEGCANIKHITIANSNLTSFQIGAFPKLESLVLPGNCIDSAIVSQLESQCKSRGITFNFDEQFVSTKTLPANISLSSTAYIYDGRAKEPDVSVPGLTRGDDYFIRYQDNIDVGTAKVSIYGLDEYRGLSITKTFSIKGIPISNASIASKTKAYTGKLQKCDAPTVKIGNNTLKTGTDFTWTCKAGKNVGSYSITVTGKGNYTGTKTSSFKIVPKSVTQKKPSAEKKKLTIKWKQPSKSLRKQLTGFKIQISTDKKFKKIIKTKIITSAKKTIAQITKLKSKKIYYIRICSYKKKGSIYYESAWSKTQKIKTK